MKNKKKCAVCSNRFEPIRSDKNYCSNACKQKAYAQRQKAELQPNEPETVFYLDEYNYLMEFFGCDYEVFDLIFFCFLRKNFSSDESMESVVSYFSSVWTGSNYEELKGSKAYQGFKERFLEGYYKVLISKK